MAAKQPDKKDVELFAAGTPRNLLIAEFGAPTQTNEINGKTHDIFTFVQGYSKGAKVGRAFFHGAADVLTAGLWEVAGTPIESVADGTEMAYEISYDDHDRVDRVILLKGAKAAPKPRTSTPRSSKAGRKR